MSLVKTEKHIDSSIKTQYDWQLLRIKDLITKIGSGVTPKGGSEVYVDKGVTFLRSQNVYDAGLRLDDVSFITNEVNNRMKNSQIKPSDILINITGASIGRTCVVPISVGKANINQHIIYLRIKKRKVDFLSYYLKSPFIKDYIMTVQAGSSKEALNMGQTLNIPVTLPKPDLQTKIAKYLDKKSQAIDKKVVLLEKKIGKYQEMRKSLINRTMTKGLNPNVKLKNSGNIWIGEIPEHWLIRRVKDLADNNKYYPIGDGDHGAIKPNMYTDKGIPYIRVQNLNWDGRIDTTKVVYITKDVQDKNKKSRLYPNDILIAKTGATVGKLGLINTNIKEANTTSSVGKVSVNRNKFLPKFILYTFMSEYFQKRLWLIASQKSAQPGFNIDDLVLFEISLPESLEEQTEIANYLDTKTSAIDNIIANIEKQIKVLTELRKTLINDVVTGKLKVTEE